MRKQGNIEQEVAGFLRAVASGRHDAVARILAFAPALADVPGPHPYWGGRPCAVTLAAEWGRTAILRDLLKAGAHPDAPAADYDGFTPLLCALARHHKDAVRLLREAGATVDVWAAAALGDVTAIRRFIEANPSAAVARGPNHATPLHFAESVHIARILVENGADRGALDKYGSTPLRCAAYAGERRRDAARYLASLEDDLDFFVAVAIGDQAAVQLRLGQDPDLVGAVDASLGPASARGGTALHIAAALGNAAMASLLIERGAKVDSSSTDGHAPLHYAAKGGHVDVARTLLEHGARLDLRDGQRDATPEDWAGFFEQHEMIEFLRSRNPV